MKQFMKDIWCAEILIRNIEFPIQVSDHVHVISIFQRVIFYQERFSYFVNFHQQFTHNKEYRKDSQTDTDIQESYAIHVHEILLLLFIFVSLWINQQIAYRQIHKKMILKYFEVDLILYKKELQNQIKIKQTIDLKRSLFPWLSLLRDILYVLFILTKFFNIQSKTGSLGQLKNIGFILSLLLLLPQLMQHKRLEIFFEVIKVSLRNMLNLVKHLSAVTLAFVLIGNFLFQKYFHFQTMQKTAATVFSMMVGDSVLDFFNETQQDGMVSFLYLILVTFYLILFWHNLYISLVTNHYFDIVDDMEKETVNQEEDSVDLLSEFDEEELLQNQAELVQNMYMKITLKLKTLRAAEQKNIEKLKKIHEVQIENRTQNLALFKSYMVFLISQIETQIEQLRIYKESIK